MTEKVDLKGQCLCGDVSVHLPDAKPHVGACHCNMCQIWCGGPGMAIDVDDQINIQGEENLRTYASSDWAERAFCGRCGTNVYYRFKAMNKYFVYAGLFADDPNLTLDHQIYIDEKPNYYSFAEQTPTLTGADVQAMFSES